jgi:glycosyltransferase involved in cell wall biosynthesis
MKTAPHLRIMMTTDTVGGVWTYSATLAMALAQRGVEIHLVTMGPPMRVDQRAMLRHDRIQLIETSLALEWQDPEGNDVARARRVLAQIESEINPDLVHLNSFREATFDWRAPVVVVAHSCVNSWALACRDTAWLNEPRWQHYTKMVTDGLNAAQAWVSPSRSLYTVLTNLYRPHHRGGVIWNGMTPSSSPKRRKDNLILAAGRLSDRAKNVTAFVKAAKGLEWRVAIAGPNAPKSQHAMWLGNLLHGDLQAIMRRAAIFVSPAFYEPFGLSVLEAASAGCSLVLSDTPTFRELWDDAAVFVDPLDSKKLHRILADLSTDHVKRAELQRAAHLRSRRYALSQTVSAYHELYQAHLASRQHGTEANIREVHA